MKKQLAYFLKEHTHVMKKQEKYLNSSISTHIYYEN
jgi:hypothetical protein